MTRKSLLCGSALLAGLVVLCVVSGPRASEPVFEGKPLDQWLEAGYEDASRVLYEVGPGAAESIFTKLKREHPQFGRWGRYRTFWNRLPESCRKLLPRPRVSGFDEWRACHSLLAMGSQVIPVLCGSLQDDHFLVRAVSAQTLGLFARRGIDIGRARPALQAALRDRDPGVRRQAASALVADQKSREAKPKSPKRFQVRNLNTGI